MEIAEALPRTRGLKSLDFHSRSLHLRYCRGIAPNEGTEIHLRITYTPYLHDCRGIAPNEGTEI